MRQIFRSQRLETVEGVAQLLAEHDIETYISERRSYKGNRRGQFSFTQSSGPDPALWLVNGADITRARELMLQAGLISMQRSESILAQQGHHKPVTPARKSVSTAMKVRIGLAITAITVAAVQLARWWLP